MAGQAKSRSRTPIKSGLDGDVNSYPDGSVTTIRGSTLYQQRSFMMGGFGVLTRLLLWWALITAIFRCPKSLSELTESDPSLCQPYLAVKLHASPYVQPIYNAYVQPVVDRANPHIEQFNERVYAPAAEFVKHNYETYGAAHVAEAQKYAEIKWEQKIRPQLVVAQDRVKAEYEIYLEPHIEKGSAAVAPYLERTKAAFIDFYQSRVLPAYSAALPYGKKIYARGHDITVDLIFPNIRWATYSTLSFLQRNVWPQVRVLYGDNVEPQLVRISERLGRHKDGRKLESAVENIDGSSNVSSTSSITASISPSFASTTQSASNPIHPGTTIEESKPATKTQQDVRAKITNDLRTWQEKFARAADKGSEDLELRVKEITDRLIQQQAHGVGEALIVQLKETWKSSRERVRTRIQRIVEKLPDVPSEAEVESALEETIDEIKLAGSAIKARSQAVRNWKRKYDHEVLTLVKAASDSTLDVIDNIRDLGLQEIGMRWAWMDGVTYKDWQKYHALKKTFAEWRDEVESVALEHPGITMAKGEGEKIEEMAMAIATEAAQELTRLRGVAKWKIHAQDASTDFSSRQIPPEGAKIVQQVERKSSDAHPAVLETPQGATASLSSIEPEGNSAFASDPLDALPEIETITLEKATKKSMDIEQPMPEGASSRAKDKAQNPPPQPPEEVFGTNPSFVDQAVLKASEVVFKSQTTTDRIISEFDSEADSLAYQDVTRLKDSKPNSKIQSVLSAPKVEQVSTGTTGIPPSTDESIISYASYSSESISPVATPSDPASSEMKVWSGVMAQSVSTRRIIYDDVIVDDEDIGYSDNLQDVLSLTEDQSPKVTGAISEVMSKPSNIQGCIEPAASFIRNQHEETIPVASNALHETQQGAAEDVVSITDKHSQAVAMSSYATYGTPKPLLSPIPEESSSGCNNAMNAISIQYSRAESCLSGRISGAREPIDEQIPFFIENAFSDSISTGSSTLGDMYKAARSQVSCTVYDPEPETMESASSQLAGTIKSAESRPGENPGIVGEVVRESFTKVPGIEFSSSVSSVESSATMGIGGEV